MLRTSPGTVIVVELPLGDSRVPTSAGASRNETFRGDGLPRPSPCALLSPLPRTTLSRSPPCADWLPGPSVCPSRGVCALSSGLAEWVLGAEPWPIAELCAFSGPPFWPALCKVLCVRSRRYRHDTSATQGGALWHGCRGDRTDTNARRATSEGPVAEAGGARFRGA